MFVERLWRNLALNYTVLSLLLSVVVVVQTGLFSHKAGLSDQPGIRTTEALAYVVK